MNELHTSNNSFPEFTVITERESGTSEDGIFRNCPRVYSCHREPEGCFSPAFGKELRGHVATPLAQVVWKRGEKLFEDEADDLVTTDIEIAMRERFEANPQGCLDKMNVVFFSKVEGGTFCPLPTDSCIGHPTELQEWPPMVYSRHREPENCFSQSFGKEITDIEYRPTPLAQVIWRENDKIIEDDSNNVVTEVEIAMQKRFDENSKNCLGKMNTAFFTRIDKGSFCPLRAKDCIGCIGHARELQEWSGLFKNAYVEPLFVHEH